MSGADSEYDSCDELPMLVESDDESDEEPENGDDVPREPRGCHSQKATLEPCLLDAQRGLTNLIMRLKFPFPGRAILHTERGGKEDAHA
jgi:hypothetical protein